MNSLSNYIFDTPRTHTIYRWTISNFQVSIKDLTQSIISNEQKEHKIDYKDLVWVFNKIWAALNEIKDIDELLALIVDELLSIILCDACSIYIREYQPDKLNFKITRTLSLETDENNLNKFQSFDVPLQKESISGYVALTWEIVNIDDCYNISEIEEYNFNSSYDKSIWYKTTSMIAVPMKSKDWTILWVLQLINKLSNNWNVIPFSKEYEDIILSIASQAAVSIENVNLFAQHLELTASLVDALSEAIDSRSPHTAWHSKRVADITLLIAETISNSKEWFFADISFSKDEMLELKYAALLHDVGKISVPEAILDKGSKLSKENIAIIRERFQSIKYHLRLTSKEEEFSDIENFLYFIDKINNSGSISNNDLEKLNEIYSKEYYDIDWNKQHYITKEELHSLSITRWNLSTEERFIMNKHIVDTQNILKLIKFPISMENIPLYAGDHHEKLNWEGYPNKKIAEDISLQARIMCIADMFEALTAFDRPYKKAMPIDDVLTLLNKEVETGTIDSNIVNLFIENKLYEKYIKSINNTI